MLSDRVENALDSALVDQHETELHEELIAELRKLETALVEYGRHKQQCPVSLAWGSGPGGTGIKCECGFDENYKFRPRGFGDYVGDQEAKSESQNAV